MADTLIRIADSRWSLAGVTSTAKKKRYRKPSTRRFVDPLAPSLLSSTHATHTTRSVPGTESFVIPGVSLPQEVKYNDITLAAVASHDSKFMAYV
jgi:hypothetical protein